MRILLVKTSSLGDIIHTLPALTDAQHHYPDLQCDWVVEEAFAEIPAWHPAVNRVIPVALRRWRKKWWKMLFHHEWRQFKQELTQDSYDYVIDAQGLLKSAWLTSQARGLRCGFDSNSARESIASFFYHKYFFVSNQQHAVERLRKLFAQILNYDLPQSPVDYGITGHFSNQTTAKQKIIILLHSTTWHTKHWIEPYWTQLAQRIITKGYAIRLPWGNERERLRAEKIAAIHPQIGVIPKSDLSHLAIELMQAHAVVGIDTGLSHLATALNIPTITLYSVTHPAKTGTYGQHQIHLRAKFPCAPCFSKNCTYQGIATVHPACYSDLSVDKVWQVLQTLL